MNPLKPTTPSLEPSTTTVVPPTEPSAPPAPKKSHWWRYIRIAILLVVLGSLSTVAWAVAHQKITVNHPKSTYSPTETTHKVVYDKTDSTDVQESSAARSGTSGNNSSSSKSNAKPGIPATPAELPGWQRSAANTGLASAGLSCSKLPAYTGANPIPAGSVVSGVRFTSAPIDLSKGNITIDRSCFQPTSIGSVLPFATTTGSVCGGTGCVIALFQVTISNSEFDGSLLSAQSAATSACFAGIANLTSTYCHGASSGIVLTNTGNYLNATISGNYVAGLAPGSLSNAFAVQGFDATTNPNRALTVSNNRFDARSGNDNAAFFVQPSGAKITNLTASGNLLEGNGYNLLLNQSTYPYSNLSFTNNRFLPLGSGAARVNGGDGWASWGQNYLNDPSKPNYQGAAVSQP